MNYPIIKIPDRLLRIKSSSIPIPPEPPQPIEPTKKSPSRLIIVIPALVIAVIAIGNVASNSHDILFIPLTSGTTTDGREYSIGLRGWHILLALTPFVFYYFFRLRDNSLEEKYKSDLMKYEAYNQNYKQELANHLNIISESNQEEKISSYREKLSQDFFKSSSEPDLLSRDVNRGRFENQFYGSLSKFFGTKIYNNLQLGYFENPYVPDFSYCDTSQKIFIDIEIDEPYILTTGEPIHYLGKDSERDTYFNNNGWSVIRFTEGQIAKYPERCCEQILILINHLSKNASLTNVVENTPQWTKMEAIEFYQTKFRNTY